MSGCLLKFIAFETFIAFHLISIQFKFLPRCYFVFLRPPPVPRLHRSVIIAPTCYELSLAVAAKSRPLPGSAPSCLHFLGAQRSAEGPDREAKIKKKIKHSWDYVKEKEKYSVWNEEVRSERLKSRREEEKKEASDRTYRLSCGLGHSVLEAHYWTAATLLLSSSLMSH